MENKFILGVNIPGHGASICVLKDNKISLFIKEERITRKKRDNKVPLLSINLIKDYTDILESVYYSNCIDDDVDISNIHIQKKLSIPILDNSSMDVRSCHHLNHASCGYYGSGFSEALCLVMDGWGHVGSFIDLMHDGEHYREDNTPYKPLDMFETCSMYKIKKGKFNLLKKYANFDGHRFDRMEDKFCNLNQISMQCKDDRIFLNDTLDFGVVYEIITKNIGFEQDDCGKTMGMAAYGEEDPDIPSFFSDEDLNVNMNLFTHSTMLNNVNYPKLKRIFTFKQKSNLARVVQEGLEKKVIQRFEELIKFDSCKNIVLSGGTFYNVVANSILLRKYPDYNFYVDPLCDDSGHSFGMSMLYSGLESYKLDNLYLGPEYSPEDIKKRIYNSVSKIQNK